ncbi:MAG: hypothetical protein ACXV7G_12055 [Halobacteriota archaeon]
MTARISKLLGLRETGQDWGIENADSIRLAEFIEFYESNTLAAWESESLAELILQSAEEALEKDDLTPALRSTVVSFLKKRHGEFPKQWSYWSGLNAGEWQVVQLLREADDA